MVEDTRSGQAVHTGWLSAAPQRFFIGSNSFRTRTCFEERSEGIVALERKARPIGGNNGGQLPAGYTGRPKSPTPKFLTPRQISSSQSLIPRSRVPAVWRYAGRAVRGRRSAGQLESLPRSCRSNHGLRWTSGRPSFLPQRPCGRWSLDIRTKEESQ